ncbi:MAG: hypothetical protein CM15mP49_11860 [Actinomycetota bacterium]|nr:MAG: hypothetical protein CM15mP49_11860 [Actinomycetota bacterium]
MTGLPLIVPIGWITCAWLPTIKSMLGSLSSCSASSVERVMGHADIRCPTGGLEPRNRPQIVVLGPLLQLLPLPV